MTIPDLQTILLPVLRIAATGDTTIADVVQGITEVFKSTDCPPSDKYALCAT